LKEKRVAYKLRSLTQETKINSFSKILKNTLFFALYKSEFNYSTNY
jgi:hypothetical protein